MNRVEIMIDDPNYSSLDTDHEEIVIDEPNESCVDNPDSSFSGEDTGTSDGADTDSASAKNPAGKDAHTSSESLSTTLFIPVVPATEPCIVPRVHNVVATIDVNCQLNLLRIALHTRNAEFNPKRFAAVIMRIRNPMTTALIFSSGKVVICGARNESASKLAGKKYAKIIEKLGFDVKNVAFKIHNIVASCDVKFPIHIEKLYSDEVQFSSYEPELFPGLVYRMVRPKVAFLIFVSGRIVLTGAKTRSELQEAFQNIYPLLQLYKK